jgi:23S rRNA (cytidine1920-2'-O)/16S rRNA (cytidine1409-2'-O)-methyltransferase
VEKKKRKERADKIIVDRGLAESRHKAQALIMAGKVYSGETRINKPGEKLNVDHWIMVKKPIPFVSRAGLKLEEAFDKFKISVNGQIVADLGASTGGFTDCLLQRGARKVYAVDVDTRQIDQRLREDPRVHLIEKNARYLDADDFDNPLDLVTLDLSFISVLKVLPALRKFLGQGFLVALIKPQFEVGKGQVGKKGVVRDPSLHQDVLVRMAKEGEKLGFYPRGLFKTSIKGQKGNQEFFLLWSLQKSIGLSEHFEIWVKEAVWNEKN